MSSRRKPKSNSDTSRSKTFAFLSGAMFLCSFSLICIRLQSTAKDTYSTLPSIDQYLESSSTQYTQAVRDHPGSTLRHRVPEVSVEYQRRVEELEKKLGKTSCRRDAKNIIQWNGDFCKGRSDIVYYNAFDMNRFVCGEKIRFESEKSFTACSEPSRLFPVVPNETGIGLPSVQLHFGSGVMFNPTAKPNFECDIPCNSVGSPGTVCERSVQVQDTKPGTSWTLRFSMEGQKYYPNLRIKPLVFMNNYFYSTTSYESEVPLPYFSWAEYDIQHNNPVDFDSAIKGASFLARNCNSRNGREKLVKALQNSPHIRVDSLSSCLNNARPPDGMALSNKVAVMRKYLFYLAFENQCDDDYITEKLWGPMVSGTVPVYYGARNVNDHVPEDSIINVHDFNSTASLAEYLGRVASDRNLYEKHQAWRSKPLPPKFHTRYDFTAIHSTCRTCRWAYARFYGLGWNHHSQSLSKMSTPRDPCVSDGLLHQPVVETWIATVKPLIRLQVGTASDQCIAESSRIVVDDKVERTIWYRDGATDLYINPISPATTTDDLSLQLEVPISSEESDDSVVTKHVKPGHLRLQDNRTRFTFITFPPLAVDVSVSNGKSTVSIPVDTGTPLRIRVLVEDVQTLRPNASTVENYFGSYMIADFTNPIEAFY